MSNKKADISQIRKYLNGELNANAMHKLEREALDDPFLMDALEGYTDAGKDQHANLNDLSGRLQQRTTEKKGRVIPWKVWSIAASVIIVLTIGGLWLKKAPAPEKQIANIALPAPDKAVAESKADDTLKTPAAPLAQQQLVAQNTKPAPVLKPVEKSTAKPADKAIYQQEISANDNKVAANQSNGNAGYESAPAAAPVKPQEEKKDNTQQLSEMVVMNYTQQSKQDSIAKAEVQNKARYSVSAVDKKLQGKVEGVTTVTSRDAKTLFGAGNIGGTSISGIIIGKDDGQPIIGAAIRIKGTNKSTVTDVNGKFAISPRSGNKETLDIVSIGYNHTLVSAQAGDSLRVELKPGANSLSEVVVTGYGSKKEGDDEPAAESAHPKDGWGSLKKYLQANAYLADGTSGTVTLLFTVDIDGTLTDFKIKKSLNTTADQKAIDLIKNGPSWDGNSTNKPEQVTVKVKFQKMK